MPGLAPPPLSVRAAAELELRRRRTEAERARIQAEAAASADIPVQTFRRFVEARNPSLLEFEHVPRLVDVGERVITGELMRVLVVMPPRYFKSEIFSRLLPAAFLQRHPDLWAGLASYGADLAWELSEEARNYFQEAGGRLRTATSAKKRWRTSEGGGMWAAGVGGPLLGRGFHYGGIDDPQDPEKAHSPTYQKRFGEWLPSKFLSRQEPGARIVAVMQRLGPEDAIDFILRREVGEDTDHAPENWHVVVCDEIKDEAPLGRWDGPRGLPPTCTLEDDPRELGDVLAPTRFDADEVAKMQRSAGIYVTAAQRQQRPAAATGDFWKEDWFQVYDVLPTNAFNGGRDWDTAYTKKEHNSASAEIKSFRGPGPVDSFPIYIDDVDWEWLEFPKLVDWMQELEGPHYVEAKASGKSTVQVLRREKIMAEEVRVEGDKMARSAGVQPIVAQGRIHVNRRVLRKLLHGDRQGLLRVTAENLAKEGKDLDVNDVFVQAITRHTKRRAKKRPHTSRSYPSAT